MNYNATCQIIETRSETTDSDELQRQHVPVEWPEQRCRAWEGSVNKQVSVLGAVGVGVWDVRLHSEKAIRAGWRVRVKVDGEDAWRDLAVLTARKVMHWHLTCQGVG